MKKDEGGSFSFEVTRESAVNFENTIRTPSLCYGTLGNLAETCLREIMLLGF